ncbi:EGF-like module-containing mucin-like hormone receptor-like 1-like [Platysternon megacephalum]|uniref:EGF-like module-containing mucin-like hormone receptor-like 1-like n=1 Tax=Platysternon megacephalum TaxID=55544 RepID=A0A4D9DPZ6_9SAUR|nr:EGF-like module-containing mucin-like hormone receptor-like 1-like [Platysternon megacephalum]
MNTSAKKQRVKQPRDRLCRDPASRARRAARRRSIRQLLCDNADCARCQEAAQQAERLLYGDRAGAGLPAGPGSPPPPTSGFKGRTLLDSSMWRGLDVLPWLRSRRCAGDQVLPPAQDPFPPSKSRSPPERQAGSRQTERRPPREDEEGLLRPQRAKGSSTEQEECLYCSSFWDETLLRGQEQAQSSSSLQHEPPLLAWELRTFLPRREEYPGPSPAQHEPFPPSQGERGWVGSFLRRDRARSPQAAPQRQAHRPDWVPFLAKSPGGARMSGREAKRQRDQESTAPRAAGEALMSLAGRPLARGSPGALRVPSRIELAEAETPFLQSDVRASLERHVQAKRLQHALGLPCTLQSALKIFMPPAPKPTARRPSGAGRVVTMPQALPFLSVGSRTELERHLQRMVHLKRWGMPRRIQESLRLLMPATPPHPRLSPLPSGRWAPKGPGPVTRAVQTPGLRARAPARASRGPARASESTPGSRCCRDTRELQGHIARKGLEIRLGALPAVLRSSQKMAALGRRDLLLPKLIPPGRKAPLARHRLCPLLRRKADSVELNVRHKHIQYLWALPTLYVESLAKMVPCPPVPPAPLLPLGVAIEFCPLETPFVAPQGRELLERHVLRKRLQHEWGLPGLVRRSLRHFMPPPPTRPRPKGNVRPAAMELRVSSGAPPIPLATKRELEAHVQRRVAERRWGLPRRVRESLRGFLPPTTAAPGTHPETRGRRASRPLRGLSARRAPRESPSRGAPVGPTAVAVSLAGPLGTAWHQQLSRDTCHQLLERHVTRKNIEIRLGLIPRRAQHSQEAARRVGKLPLPRLLRPGQRSLELRPRELLFLEQAASDHLELNLLHKHLSFRWGLPTLYRQSLAKLFHAGPSPAPPPSSSRAAGTEFTEQELPFLPPGARDELELHVRKKRLQHEWGLPLIVQKSMRGLMAAPPRPGQPKAPPPADGDVAVLQAELSFLSEGSRRELELSLRKRLMHRRWGLPRRIQESLRLLRPASVPAEFGPRSRTEKDAEGPFLLPWHKSTVHLERGVGKARRVVAAPRPRLSLGRDAQERLQIHVAKKCVETRLGAVPAAVRRSWQRLHLVSRLPLPKLIPAGDTAPKARTPLLPFVHPEDVCHLELNVQHKHLTALWGLGTLYTQSLSRMVPRAPPGPVPPRETEVEFWAREALFLGPEAREALELHVRKKKLQHEWGFPALIERSLRAFVPEPRLLGPTAARQRAELHVLVLGQEPSLMDGDTRGRLERHLRKMLLQRRWGLPRRIQESLRMFLPPAPPGAAPRGQTQPLLHVCHTRPQGPTALSTGQSGELQPGPREPLTHRSQHWLVMGGKEGKASCPEAGPQHALGSSSRRSQETSQTSDGEGLPGSPRRFPEDKAELKSTLDFPGKKVVGISHRAQESQRRALRPAAHEPHPQQREQSSEESPGQWRTRDGEGAPRLAGTGRCSRSSSVETAVWNEKRISRELESSFRRMARSRRRHGPGGKQPLSLEIVAHLEMDHCTCLDCPCCKLEGRDGARSPGASSPVWQTQRICARGSATLLGDAAAPSPLHAEPGWQGQGAPSVVKDEPSASSPSSLEGSESRASAWSAGESARAASRPAPEEPSLARGHLAAPRAAAHRLDIHLAQKALGSFILPPCVRRSQAVYADMAAERLKAAAQEHRREMNIRLQRRRGRKSQLGGPRQEALGERARPAGTGEPGFPPAGSLGQRLIRESQSQANQYLCETCHGLFTAGEEGLSPPPCPAKGAGKSDVARAQLETRVCPRDRETSGDVCRGEQGASYQRSQDLGRAAGAPPYKGPTGTEDGEGARDQTWAPPAHRPQPVTRDDAGDRGPSAASDELVCPLSSSQWPASPSEQRPRSAEGLSQFTTEGEWERVGDWDSEAVAAWDAAGAGSLGWKERKDTERRRGMGEMPAEGTGLRAGTNMRQTEALVLTEAPPRAEQPPQAPPGRGAESPSVPCKGKGPTFRRIMLGFLKRVTSRASVGKRGRVERSVAAPHEAPPPPQKLAPSPKSVTFNAKVHVRAEGTGPSAEYGGYQERVTLRVTECRERKAHDPSGTPAAAAGPSAPWPPPPACPAARDARTTGSHKGEGGEGVTSLKAADPRQQGAGRAQSCAVRDVCTAGAFTSSQLDERLVVIGLILEKKLGLRHGPVRLGAKPGQEQGPVGTGRQKRGCRC